MSNEQRDIVKRVNALVDRIADPYLLLLNKPMRDEVLKEITRLRKIESVAKDANMTGPDGNVRKVLGDLPITEHGAIVGQYAKLYDILQDKPCISCLMVARSFGLTPPDLRHMFSTPASERENKEKA